MNKRSRHNRGYLLARREGFALPAVIIVLIVITVLGFGYLTLGFFESNETRKERDNAQAFFLAEAGAQRTYYRLSVTDDWSTLPSQLYTDVSLDDGTYSVVLSNKTSNTVDIETVGTVRGMVRRVRVDLEQP